MSRKDDILFALQKADAAGNIEDARHLAQAYDAIPEPQQQNTPRAPGAAPVVPPEYQREKPNFWAQMGRGMHDVYEGGKQMYLENFGDDDELVKFNKETADERELYNAGQGDDFDVGRLAGNIAPWAATAPFMPAGMGIRGVLGLSALEGGAAGGTTYLEEGDSRIENTIIGGLGGAVGGGLAHGAVKAAGPLTRMATGQFNRAKGTVGNLAGVTPGKAIQKQMGAGLTPDPNINARQQRFDDLGFTGESGPTTKQVTRDPQTWTAESELMKDAGSPGARLTQRARNQDSRFTDVFNELRAGYGRSGDEVIDARESITAAVSHRYDRTQEAIGKLYKKAEEQYGDLGGVDIRNILTESSELGDDVALSKITDSVVNRMRRLGLVDEDGIPTGETLTISQAEGLRKFIRRSGAGNATTGEANFVKGKLINALDDSVFNTVGDDAYGAARQSAKARFDEFGNKIASRIVKGIENGDDAVKDILLKNNSTHIKELRDTLMKSEGGEQAISALKAEVIDYLENTARAGKPDYNAFSGAAFDRGLERIGKKKIQALFGDDMAELYKIRDVGLDLTSAPPFSNVNYSNTASVLKNMGVETGLGLPMLGPAARSAGKTMQANSALKGSPVSSSMKAQRSADISRSLMNSPVYRAAQGLLHPALLGEETALDLWD